MPTVKSVLHRGVALVTVMAVLTVLALLAAMFTVFTAMDMQVSQTSVARVTADMIGSAGFNHALSMLWSDVIEQPAWDYAGEPWRRAFLPVSRIADDIVNIDGLPASETEFPPGVGRWFYVTSQSGRVLGRYAVLIEDECGKININTATALGTMGQHQGVAPFELLLSDGLGRGLPLSLNFCKKIVAYRYGRDLRPGQANVDDNMTAVTYAFDEIDNNANGVIDEPGEGIDEPEEYSALRPVYDDRVFASVDEMLDVCSETRPTPSVRAFLRRMSTIHSRSRETFYDQRSGAWRKQANLNVASRDQVRRVMNRANAEARFEGNSRNLSTLVANLIDYRDENHVLTTAGSEYGVEAVCFNEVVAYDCSFFQETDYGGWGDMTVLHFNRMYGADKYFGGGLSARNRWRVKDAERVGGNLIRITLDPPYLKPPGFDDFMACEQQIGGWPRNLWRGAPHSKPGKATINVVGAGWVGGNVSVECDVDSSAQGSRTVVVRCPPDEQYKILTNANRTVCLKNAWTQHGAMYCAEPENTEMYCFQVPNPNFPTISWGDLWKSDYRSHNFYYRVINANHCFEYLGPSRIREMDMDGDGNNYSVTQELRSPDGNYRLQYLYKNGEAVRQNNRGYIPVVLTSSTRCRTSNPELPQNFCNFSDSMYFIRPDIVELINISDRPISMRGWRVVVNTGIEANELAVIDSARYFRRGHGQYDDPNPTIPPNGYFYLTNNRELFGVDYCDGNHTYGGNAKETIPVYELPDANWGISYRVTRVSDNRYIYVEGADWRKDQLKGEMVEYEVERKSTARRDVPNGQLKAIFANGRNYIETSHPNDSGLRAGDRIRVRGLPRQGGFVSFTLRNEYGQVAARTTEYGSLEKREIGYSTEKFDPTHYTWVKTARPTISGDPRNARNHSLPTGNYVPPHVKNNRFVSVGELQKVRKAEDWENIGTAGRGRTSTRTIKAIARYFTVAGVRLDAEEEGAHVSGWRKAYGTATTLAVGSTFNSTASWEPGIWKGQTLRLLSGPMLGETFHIKNSTQSGITVDGLSTAAKRTLTVARGDRFSVGPGYSTPMYYCRQNGQAGIWEWRNKGLEPINYGLYIFGLSDSINTTEFLEENHNAEIRVAVYNFRTERFDELPLADEKYSITAEEDVYRMVRSRARFQCDKSDGIYCGMIRPEHISSAGGVRLRLIPSNLGAKLGSGFAWFDYAYLAPGVINGKLNINTASERVLTALPNVSPALAANISAGIDISGKASLKPYRNTTDILDVRGFQPDNFSSVANLITTRSDQYRVLVVAQALDCAAPDGTFNPQRGDRIIGETRRDVVVDRSQLSDDDPQNDHFLILQNK